MTSFTSLVLAQRARKLIDKMGTAKKSKWPKVNHFPSQLSPIAIFKTDSEKNQPHLTEQNSAINSLQLNLYAADWKVKNVH